MSWYRYKNSNLETIHNQHFKCVQYAVLQSRRMESVKEVLSFTVVPENIHEKKEIIWVLSIPLPALQN